MRRDLTVLATALLSSCVASCTEADLYLRGDVDDRADRVALSGRTCTTPPHLAPLRTKLLLLVDTADGPLFRDWDPDGTRIGALSETLARHGGSARFSAAVASWGPWARSLAPEDAPFTPSVFALDQALDTLALPQGCAQERCRDLDAALDLARARIEADLAPSPLGVRAGTAYVVVLLAGGGPDPMLPDAAGATERLVAATRDLRDSVLDAGALSMSLHALHRTSSPRPGPRHRARVLRRSHQERTHEPRVHPIPHPRQPQNARRLRPAGPRCRRPLRQAAPR